MKRCHKCKRNVEPTMVGHSMKVGDIVFASDIPALRCVSCGETTVAANDVREFEERVADELVFAGIVSGPAMKFIRKTMALASKEFARLIACSPETVSRWESESVSMDRSAMAVLVQMYKDYRRGEGDTRHILERMTQPPPIKKKYELLPVRRSAG